MFLNAKGQPVNARSMLNAFKFYCEKAGIPDTRTIHGMRNRRATDWLEAGFTLKDVKEMLGHYSIEITDRLSLHSRTFLFPDNGKIHPPRPTNTCWKNSAG